MVGDNRGAEPLEKRKLLSSIREDGLGMGEKGDYISFKATINYIKHESDTWYTACPTEGCNKKVVNLGSGSYRCEKCDREFPGVSFMLHSSYIHDTLMIYLLNINNLLLDVYTV